MNTTMLVRHFKSAALKIMSLYYVKICKKKKKKKVANRGFFKNISVFCLLFIYFSNNLLEHLNFLIGFQVKVI